MTRGVVTLLLLVACGIAVVLAAATPAGAAPLRTALVDPSAFSGPNMDLAFAKSRAAGASIVRLNLYWRNVELSRPADRTNPDDPAYNWGPTDNEIVRAVAHGFDPLVVIMSAPDWESSSGQGPPGTNRPDADAFGAFARAAARRYSGTFVPNQDPYAESLPRVRFWQAWNEPNRDYFFRPQFSGRTMVSPGLYRTMVNRFAEGVRSVHSTNLVVAGGLAPLGRPGKPAPLAFMRSFLASPVKFDIWAHHPYTSGGPMHHATARDDVALGDMPEMRALLNQRIKARRIVSTGRVQFWVTEFSWDSAPPDRRALPQTLHQRWVAEALYRMWRSGVELVTWFKIWDDPLRSTPYQSGFYTGPNGRAKGSLKAFRFPTVAFRQTRGIYVWGRTPTSQRGTVVVELKSGRRWRRLGTVRAGTGGMFARTFRSSARKGYVRARFGGEYSLGFSLTPSRDRYVNPFGCGGGIPC